MQFWGGHQNLLVVEDKEGALFSLFWQARLLNSPRKTTRRFTRKLSRRWTFLDKSIESKKYLKKALRISPKCSDALFSMGGLIFGEEKYEEAIKYFEKAIKNAGKSDGVTVESSYYLMADAFRVMKKFDNALNTVNIALKKFNSSRTLKNLKKWISADIIEEKIKNKNPEKTFLHPIGGDEG